MQTAKAKKAPYKVLVYGKICNEDTVTDKHVENNLFQ